MFRKYGLNALKFYIRNALCMSAGLFASGTMIQSFLATLGVDAGLIGLHSSILNIVYVLATMACSAFADRYTETKKMVGRFMLLYGVMFFGLVPFVVLSGVGVGTAFVVILILTVVQMCFSAIRTYFDYKLPYLLFEMGDYGVILSVDVIVNGIISIGIGFLINFSFASFPANTVFLFAFLLCAVFLGLAFLINRSFRTDPSLNAGMKSEKSRYKFTDLVKLPVFTRLIVPNFLRGFATGFIGIAAVFAIARGYNSTQTSYLVTASSFATLLSGGVYALLAHNVSNRTFCLIGGLCHLPLMFMASGSLELFLLCYALSYGGKMMVDTAVPALVYEVVPYEMSGIYNAWRMIFTAAGTALSAAIGGYLIHYLPMMLILGSGAACQLASSLVYYNRSWRRYGVSSKRAGQAQAAIK